MTPDVNVLVAAFRRGHSQHRRARAWLDAALDACAQGRSTFVLLDVVVAGFVRVTTNARAFPDPDPLENAVAFIDALLASPGVEGRSVSTWPALRSKLLSLHLTGNAVTDAWIAAAVASMAEHLVSFDHDFQGLLPARDLTFL